jgi:hypothetical protein
MQVNDTQSLQLLEAIEQNGTGRAFTPSFVDASIEIRSTAAAAAEVEA